MGYKTYTCPHAAVCGACEWLAVPYEKQLERKHAALEELFAATGVEVEPVVGMKEPLRYRAKVMVPFVSAGKGPAVFGMYRRGTHDIVAAEECLVEYPAARPILRTIAKLAWKHRIRPYDEDAGTGLLRHAVIRCAYASDEVMVTLVINRREFPHKKEFVRELREAHPEIVTVVFNVNTRNTNAVLGPHDTTAYGQGWLDDELAGCTFRIPSSAFYQTNPAQTELLYAAAARLADLRGGECVLDAYCGIGTVGLAAVSYARAHARPKHKKKAAKAAKRGEKQHMEPVRLIGVESVPAAIEAARENARINHVDDAEFACGDAGEFMVARAAAGQSVDVLLMDPPRAGASEAFLEAACRMAPQRIVYISCNPATQVRDIQMLDECYELRRIVPVDMFPHTKHIETVALLRRR